MHPIVSFYTNLLLKYRPVVPVEYQKTFSIQLLRRMSSYGAYIEIITINKIIESLEGSFFTQVLIGTENTSLFHKVPD